MGSGVLLTQTFSTCVSHPGITVSVGNVLEPLL